MAKLTKFKAQQVEFPTHYEVEETNRGNNKIKSIVPAFGNIRENGTPETEEIYDGLQLGNVHTLQANKTTNLNIDYYVCNLDGLNEFGVNNDLKLRINVDSKNTNSTTKLRLNNNDYTILKEYNGNLKQIEAGDFKPNKTYELTYNGSQFVVINVDSRLNEIMGLEFAGNIQDAGDKVRGKCYFDNVTKFYYECIEDNSLTYNDSGKFRAISNKPISDKVEKLYEKRAGFTRVGHTLIQWGYIENPSGSATLNYPVPFAEGTLPIVTIANWVNTDLIVLTTQNNRFCSFRSSKAISLNWIAVGLIS
nr:MAG TPA: Putative tail fiber protein fold, Tail fiber, receptor [Caudoviricetes sp.]